MSLCAPKLFHLRAHVVLGKKVSVEPCYTYKKLPCSPLSLRYYPLHQWTAIQMVRGLFFHTGLKSVWSMPNWQYIPYLPLVVNQQEKDAISETGMNILPSLHVHAFTILMLTYFRLTDKTKLLPAWGSSSLSITVPTNSCSVYSCAVRHSQASVSVLPLSLLRCLPSGPLILHMTCPLPTDNQPKINDNLWMGHYTSKGYYYIIIIKIVFYIGTPVIALSSWGTWQIQI